MRRAEYDDLMQFAARTAIDINVALKSAKSEQELSLRFDKLCRMARRCQQQLIKRAGDLLLLCEDLINTNTSLFINNVLILRFDDIIKGEQESLEEWHISFTLSVRLMEFLLDVESPQNFKETKRFLRSKGANVSRVDDMIENALEYEDYWACQAENKWPMPIRFSTVYGVTPYKICRRVCKYLGFKSNVTGGNLKRMYILVFTVCLYTAIRNELERLCNEMEDEGYEDVRERYGIPLDIRAEVQKPSKNVTKQPARKEGKEEYGFVPISEAEIDALFDGVMKDVLVTAQESAPVLSEKTEEEKVEPTEERKQEIEQALAKHFNTEGAQNLLQRIKKAGLCDEYYVWSKGKWPKHDGDDVLALAYLAQEASKEEYIKAGMTGNKNHVSWRAFHNLFEYTGKRVDGYGKTQLQIERNNSTKDGNDFLPLGMKERCMIDNIVHPA